MFFWNSLAFSMIQQMLTIWSLVPLPFLKPAWTSGSSWFTYCWSLAWRILNITSVWNECNCAIVWAFLGIAFLWVWNKNWPFPVLWPLLSFPNFLALSSLPARQSSDSSTWQLQASIVWSCPTPTSYFPKWGRRKWQLTPVSCLENPMDRGAWQGSRESATT